MVDADRLRVELFARFIETGRPPAASELAAALGASEREVAAGLRELAAARMVVLDGDELWMANPLSAVPTGYQAVAGGRRYDCPCIWDSLGAVAMLGGEGRVECACPCCGEEMAVAVGGGEARPPDGAIAHFVVPAARWWDDIGFT